MCLNEMNMDRYLVTEKICQCEMRCTNYNGICDCLKCPEFDNSIESVKVMTKDQLIYTLSNGRCYITRVEPCINIEFS